MREMLFSAIVVSTIAFLLWLILACAALNRLRKIGAPVPSAQTLLLGLVGYRPGVQAAIHLLQLTAIPGQNETLPRIVILAQAWGRVIVPAWFVLAIAGSALWLSGKE